MEVKVRKKRPKPAEHISKPEILAPAGNRPAFLAALAAGADAVYCGLKAFSARMEAPNFTLEELASLVRLAHEEGVRVYVAFNSLVKPGELEAAGHLIDALGRFVRPDALIVQDLALIELARQTGFAGELHLSTLANLSFARALPLVQTDFGARRVVLPRELTIDEIKALAGQCPPGISLEVFIHGALCYGVSGRCYWSSFLGGKSGLRGRCVQPCRRQYDVAGERRRFFSCQDLSLDVLVKLLLEIPQVRTWKIEGRKKGPHYVYYTVAAYRLLRDHAGDPQAKKDALGLLSQALGRPGTHYGFLPQRPYPPMDPKQQAGSGLFLGKLKGDKDALYLEPRQALLAGDVLRLGYEDEPPHRIHRVKKSVPKGGRLFLKLPGPARAVPAFLVDRREPALEEMIQNLEARLAALSPIKAEASGFVPALPPRSRKLLAPMDLHVARKTGRKKTRGFTGLWLSADSFQRLPDHVVPRIWWWLPPVVWPRDEESLGGLIQTALRKGCRNFVLNMPWQTAFFAKPENLNLWAGPFCNFSNPLALEAAARLNLSGAIISPELGRDDCLALPANAPLPLGVVIAGHWPLCISRTLAAELKPGQPFTSPKGETAWVRQVDGDFWIYPNWRLDLGDRRGELRLAGYTLFVTLDEPVPVRVKQKDRPGLWNWEVGLK